MDDITIRVSVFIVLIILIGTAQHYFPRRKLQHPLPQRWLINFGMVLLDTLLVRLLLGALLPATVAQWAMEQQIGLFYWLGLPVLIVSVLSVLLLDALIYWQHRLFHRVPVLWRLHRIHHYDDDYDLSTALRFHPLEIILSVLIKSTAIALLGIPVIAVILFETLLNGMALFNHANLRLPSRFDTLIRLIFVTPDMHRVHHSVYTNEMHSNFGFNLSLWDRLFGSYQAHPKDGHQNMMLGQPDSDALPVQNLLWLLGSALYQPNNRRASEK